MYHSISETRHPLQTEEQEIGIDPLQSFVNKPEDGEFHSVWDVLSSPEAAEQDKFLRIFSVCI